MALMNGQQYKASIKKMRPNVYKWGELIEDVTTHPATRLHVQSVATSYDAAFDPEKAPIFTANSQSDRRNGPPLEHLHEQRRRGMWAIRT